MRIENIEVYGLGDSLIRAGYPARSTINFDEEFDKRIKRGGKLGSCKPGTGHDSFLKGIVVQFDITAHHGFWLQFMRYDFMDIISSQTKDKLIFKLDIRDICHPDVTEKTIENFEEVREEYLNKENKTNKDFEKLIINAPIGLELTAGISLNYLQLKTMYVQRKKHKSPAWQEFWNIILPQLPYFNELVDRKED